MKHSSTPLSPRELEATLGWDPPSQAPARRRLGRALEWVPLLLFGAGVCGHAFILKTEPGIGLSPTDPVELETPDEAPRILQARRIGDSLELHMRGAKAGTVTEIVQTIPITEPPTRFATPFDGCATAQISVTETIFHGASIPFHSGPLRPVAYWTEGFLDYEHPDDIAAARSEIASIPDFATAESTLARLEVLYTHLRRELLPHWGNPKPEHRKIPGLAMMNLARRQGAKVDCGPSSLILAAYANLAGLPTRVISLMGERGDLAVGRHTMTEHWDGETNRWILSDMVNGAIRFDTPTMRGASLYRALTTWRSSEAMGLDPVIENSRPHEKLFVPSRYFLNEATAIYQRPHDILGGGMSKIWRTIVDPKPAWAENSASLHDRATLRRVSTAALLMAAGLMLVCITRLCLKRQQYGAARSHTR